jgi:DNA-binding response OmpR family regulator/predicted regulator of Ras-like GTPase activity (Roadblock/LC7/MglB family)
MPLRILLVDDSEALVETLRDGLAASDAEFDVVTAPDVDTATALLDAHPVDLVITDVNMPGKTGFDLLAHLVQHHPGTPSIVMTGYGTPAMERQAKELGCLRFLAKPLEIDDLRAEVDLALADLASGDLLKMISQAGFLQLLALERSTCLVNLETGDQTGQMAFEEGRLCEAAAGGLSGTDAVLEMLGWEAPAITLRRHAPKKGDRRDLDLQALLMEAARREDEQRRATHSRKAGEGGARRKKQTHPVEEEVMAKVDEIIAKMADVEGFLGAAIFSPQGELLAVSSVSKVDMEKVGVLANNTLLNAQKASLEMGTGRGQLVHIEAEKAHILVRCKNEGSDPVKSEPGKAHIHTALVLDKNGQVGMGKMRLNAAVEELAEHFR